MRKINKPKIKNSIINLVIGLSYPTIKYCASESQKFLHFLDSMTIVGLVYLVIGIFTAIYLHGDLDSMIFRMKHPRLSDNSSFEVFKKNKEKEREESFNYPLFSGILFIVLSYILASCFY